MHTIDYLQLGTADYIRLEEKINTLQQDKKIKALREALPEYIKDRLRERGLQRLADAGIIPALEAAFLAQEAQPTKVFWSLLKDNAEKLELSGKMLLELRRNARLDRACALEALKQMLLKREIIRFRKEADIAARIWISVLNSTVIPGEIILDKIRNHLNLTPQQLEEFNRRALHRVFYVEDSLREAVFRFRENTGMSVTEFQRYAYIGKDAWEAFYQATKAQPKKTSQETLLKLVIGFGLEEPEAWDFMETAGSAFVVRLDLVFLACISCGYQKPLWVMEILDFFAEDAGGNPLYANPYY